MGNNAEIVGRALDAFNRGGVDAALEYLDPEIEWWGPQEWLEERRYCGHDGVRRLASSWTQAFDEYRIDVDETKESGNAVLALCHQRGRMKGTGDRIEDPIAYIWEIRNGKATRVDVYFSWEAAVDAASRAARHAE
ncbi:MAG TPA: nuclear transport factor 2 family protein [Thermoleophilaceae bacterium]|nr:nuclear transport factor 2 family protein [Thermoleophilaceae bacterium]